jgi:hypothetical protein
MRRSFYIFPPKALGECDWLFVQVLVYPQINSVSLHKNTKPIHSLLLTPHNDNTADMDDLQLMTRRNKQVLLDHDSVHSALTACTVSTEDDDSNSSFSLPDELCWQELFDGDSYWNSKDDGDDGDDGSLLVGLVFEDDLPEEEDLESIQPIVFAGMDYGNCMSYYALYESQQDGGGMVRRVRPRERSDQHASPRISLLDGNQDQLRSCLRTSTRRATRPPVLPIRRFSLAVVPVIDQDPFHTSTSRLPSKDDTQKVQPRRVCFTDHVRVKRLPSITDDSVDTRDKLWYSKNEWRLSMQQQQEPDSARAA